MQAFVALGGQPDGKGHIDKDRLRQIVKADFDLAINVEVSFNIEMG